MICTGCERNSFLPLLLRFRPGKKSLSFSIFLRFRREAPKNCFLLFSSRFLSAKRRKNFLRNFFRREAPKRLRVLFSRREAPEKHFGIFLCFHAFLYFFTVLGNYIFASSFLWSWCKEILFHSPICIIPRIFGGRGGSVPIFRAVQPPLGVLSAPLCR